VSGVTSNEISRKRKETVTTQGINPSATSLLNKRLFSNAETAMKVGKRCLPADLGTSLIVLFQV